jgi:hypothetical protein
LLWDLEEYIWMGDIFLRDIGSDNLFHISLYCKLHGSP